MTNDNEFRGFSRKAVTFLSNLRDNNERAWFNDHKSDYEREIREPAKAFALDMGSALKELTGRAHGHKIFRIHRDVRFSKDKTPYNTHLHIAFIPESEKPSPPCWFFGLDPDGLTLGTGIFAFDKDDLDSFRRRVLGPDGTRLSELVQRLEKEGIRFGKPDLKRIPSGYPNEHPAADLLRYKGFSAWTDHADSMTATDPALVWICGRDFARLKPVFDWLSL
ncbi:MAG: DUF2461 domain-containing protein [Pseudomonadota bacterium]